MLTSVAGWTCIVLICAAFVLFTGRNLWIRHELASQQKLYKRYRDTRPSVYQLPPLEAMSEQDVFILEPIAGSTPQPIGRTMQKATLDQPEQANFRMCYMRLSTERCTGNPPEIDLEIIQYPTAEWSAYKARGQAFGSGPGYYHSPQKLVRSVRPILALNNPHDPGKGEFYWTSGSILVIVRSYISDPDPFIRAYLERFPSTM